MGYFGTIIIVVLAGTQKSAMFWRKFLFCLRGFSNMIHSLKYGYSSQKRNSQTNAKSFPSGIYPRITLTMKAG